MVGDIFDGRGGADTVIIKGTNKPIVYIDNPGDKIIRSAQGWGAEEIRSTISYTLEEPDYSLSGPNVDSVANRLVLLGDSAIKAVRRTNHRAVRRI